MFFSAISIYKNRRFNHNIIVIELLLINRNKNNSNDNYFRFDMWGGVIIDSKGIEEITFSWGLGITTNCQE